MDYLPKALTTMAKTKTRKKPLRVEVLYSNDAGESVDKTEATRVEIIEYNEEGEVVQRTYGQVLPGVS